MVVVVFEGVGLIMVMKFEEVEVVKKVVVFGDKIWW